LTIFRAISSEGRLPGRKGSQGGDFLVASIPNSKTHQTLLPKLYFCQHSMVNEEYFKKLIESKSL